MFTSSPWSASTADAAAFDAETDRADATVVEVTLLWGDGTLAVRHVGVGQTLTLGDEGCDLLLSGATAPVRIEHDDAGVRVAPSDRGSIAIDGWPRDLAPFDLGLGHRAEIAFDAFTVRMRVVAAGKAAPLTMGERVRQGGFASIAVSFAVHASLVATLAYFLPSLGQDDSEAIDRDRLYAMKAMLDNIAEKNPPPVEASGESSANEGKDSGGQRAQGAEGKAGTHNAKTEGHYAVKGNAKPDEVTLARSEDRELAKNFGMIELLGMIPTSNATDAITVPWGSVANGMDDRNHRGDFWSSNLNDAFGSGLGFSGGEEGGGGSGQGIGINDFGGLGRSLSTRLGGGTCASPPCEGIGHGIRQRGHDATKAPRMRTEKMDVNGKLPPEVIQRIVRMSHGRFRNCYEAGLRTNPSLAGRVAVKFMIGRDGAVSVANDAGSDLPDQSVRQCVVQGFYSLSFPTPQGGSVAVTYPLVFSPSE